MQNIQKTVFLSYRRANFPWALSIFQDLTHHGYDVFFDFTGIASGDFERVILESICARVHFLVLLTPSALERCKEPDDWLRREIEMALATRRNIVPLMLDGFDFGAPAIDAQLSGALEPLRHYNALQVPAPYFAEAMQRLRDKYLSIPLDAVLHPLSPFARRRIREQQTAAESAPLVRPQELSGPDIAEASSSALTPRKKKTSIPEPLTPANPTRERSDGSSSRRKANERAPESTPLPSAGRNLVLSSLDYPPFSGEEGCFFEATFRHFFDLAGLSVSSGPKQSADVILSVFESTNGMVHHSLKFWRMPIRLSLGAVCHRKYEDRIDRIASALTQPGVTDVGIRPIVVAGSVGAFHCMRRLGLKEFEVTLLHDSDPRQLMFQLKNEATAGGIPVVCGDELTVLRVLDLMGEQGRFIFPMNTGEEREPSNVRRELPLCFLAVATRRADTSFNEFMSDALQQYFSTEIELTAAAWVKLAQRLAADIFQICMKVTPMGAPRGDPALVWASAWRWVWNTLVLDLQSIESYFDSALPWKPILRRARQLVQYRIAQPGEEKILTSLVLSFFTQRQGDTHADISPENLKSICRLFDIYLSPENMRAEMYAGKPKHLVQVLQAALCGETDVRH